MTNVVSFERPYAIRDAGGNVLYESAAWAAGSYDVQSGEASATIGRGEAVINDPTGIFARWDYATTGADTIPVCQMKGLRVASAASVGFLGIALESIPVSVAGATPYVGRVASPGTVGAVLCTGGSGVMTVGFPAVASATVGSVTVAGAKSATVPAYGTVLGEILKTNTVAAPGTGSITQAGVLVAPY